MVTTFLPFPDFKQSISVLDTKRLGKQRVEASQILKAIRNGGGYAKHPATKMWIGYENALCQYYNICLDEWESRGFTNNMVRENIAGEIVYPWYIGWEIFHNSHKASLYRKDTEFYSCKFKDLESIYINRGYIWPSHHGPEILILIANLKIDQLDLVYTNNKPLFAKINYNGIKKKTLTVKQLMAIARDRNLTGYSKLKKNELLNLLGL